MMLNIATKTLLHRYVFFFTWMDTPERLQRVTAFAEMKLPP